MKKNKLKTLIERKKFSYGSWLTIPNILIPEILAPAGFDWMCVDMEHSSIELGELLQIIISIEKNNMVPLVRVGENNSNLIKRVMDAGSYGVIVPNICSREEAENAVNSVKYPPIGKRGFGLYRAQQFGRKFEEYINWVKKESLVIIQIEHIDAVENIDEIFSVKGIDAFLIGPYDLSGSLGKPGKLNSKEVNVAIDKILKSGKKHNLCAGIHIPHIDFKLFFKYKKKGINFLGCGMDSTFLEYSSTDMMKKLKK